MENNPWKVIAQKQVYENAWISLTECDVINPSGGAGIYGKIHFKNTAVGILVLDAEWNTYLVGQYRLVPGRYSWEIPEGGSALGSDPLEGAKRELLEETGLKAEDWQVLQTVHLSNSVTDEFAIIYLAREITQHDAAPEETEELVVKKIPFEDAYRMVETGAITDSMSVIAITKLRLLLAEGKLI
jgi:8-oxo-dGTP pyrophosphatase MutT (NUDIX family)